MNAYMAYKVTTKVRFQSARFSRKNTFHLLVARQLEVLSFIYCSLSVSPAQTSMAVFKNKDFSVKRRFSDFLGLHSKLASKYLHVGYIVPPAPEKSIVGKSSHLDVLQSVLFCFCVGFIPDVHPRQE